MTPPKATAEGSAAADMPKKRKAHSPESRRPRKRQNLPNEVVTELPEKLKQQKEAARKAKLQADFPNEPNKFAYKAHTRPTSLRNEKRVTFSSAVLQALSATMDAAILYQERGQPHLFSIDQKDKTADDVQKIKATRQFVDLIAEMQHQNEQRPSNPVYFERSFAKVDGNAEFDATHEADAATYAEKVLDCVSSGSTEETYKMGNRLRCSCWDLDCKCKKNQEYESYDEDWILRLHKPGPLYRGRYGDTRIPAKQTSLHGLLYEKLTEEDKRVPCTEPHCSSMVKQYWAGMYQAPSTLICKFDRSVDGSKDTYRGYFVDLPEESTFEGYVAEAGKKYVLTAVIKSRGGDLDNATYTAYVRTENGSWWRCKNESVTQTDFQEVNSKKDGDAYLAFYKLEE
jgi:hypothetical protein